jgi:hypothetical protein
MVESKEDKLPAQVKVSMSMDSSLKELDGIEATEDLKIQTLRNCITNSQFFMLLQSPLNHNKVLQEETEVEVKT